MLSIVVLSIVEYSYTDNHHAVYRYAGYSFTGYSNAKCLYAKCQSIPITNKKSFIASDARNKRNGREKQKQKSTIYHFVKHSSYTCQKMVSNSNFFIQSCNV